MRIILTIIFLIVICASGCEKSVLNESKSFLLMVERRNAVGGCYRYSVNIESGGKVTATRNCTFFVECEIYESNGTSVEKRRCPKNKSENLEKQLSDEELKELIEEIKKSNFFSFKDDCSYNSKNCSTLATDMPSVILTIKFDEKEKTINHYHGCWVNSWFSKENALQPLTDLENTIDEIVETKRWIGEGK